MPSDEKPQSGQEKASGVQVSCRIRGLSPEEQAAGCHETIQPLHADPQRKIEVAAPSNTHSFQFDHIFSAAATQQEVFTTVGEPCVRDLLTGYNCTLLAYGQTGSGKTHTTIGGDNDQDGYGLVPRILDQLFDGVKQESNAAITASFVEVYQERLRDLLLPASSLSSKSILRIREDKELGSVWIDGATEISLMDLPTARATLKRGIAHRAVGATQLNRDSSRSHAVFAVTLIRTTPIGERVRARLCVVDLAGSEQAKKTRATGTRLEEAKHINRSLSALGNVIHGLTSASAGSSYIPYRDSKLTRLLQSSLGGNAKTHLLLTCASASCHVEETLSTLRFGARAKRMRNQPTVNLNASSTPYSSQHAARELLETLQRKVESLCRYIRELEDAAAATTSCACQSKVYLATGTAPDADDSSMLTPQDLADDYPDPAVEEPEMPNDTSAPMSNDLLMQAELMTLRRALDGMRQLQLHEQQHAQALLDAVYTVEQNEVEKLHVRQTREIERLDRQLTDAEREIAALQKAIHGHVDREAELSRKLSQYESSQRREDDASSAEREILRRQLDHSERILKTMQLELAASHIESAELRRSLERSEQERHLIEEELDTTRAKIQKVAAVQPSALPLPSPRRSKLAQAVLRPVTVASERNESLTAAIQSWWVGETRSTNNPDQDAHDECISQPVDPHGISSSYTGVKEPSTGLTPKTSSAARCSTSIGAGRHRLDALEETNLRTWTGTESASCEEQRQRQTQLHTSGGSRPFRARLVGLLNSLEAETSSYKEMLQPSSANQPSAAEDLMLPSVARPRPSQSRIHTRRPRLPELATGDGSLPYRPEEAAVSE